MSDEEKDHMQVSVKTAHSGGFLKNVSTNVKGPAVSVVLLGWIAGVVALSIWGGPLSGAGMGLMGAFMGFYMTALSRNSN
jgi:hypothetical protein